MAGTGMGGTFMQEYANIQTLLIYTSNLASCYSGFSLELNNKA